jgi:uncharacterized metal-binding protein YceD (DUF177 family)
MMLDISPALRLPGAEISFEHLETLPEQDVLGELVRFSEPVKLTGTFTLTDETLFIKARLQAVAHASCARCLSPVKHLVDIPLEESFRRVQPGAEDTSDPWEEQLVFTGNRVELGPLVLSLTLLDLPIRFLCGESCRGTPGTAGDAGSPTIMK